MMPLHNIRRCTDDIIEEIAQLENRDTNKISVLERDLLLSRIRVLYQMVAAMEIATLDELQQQQEELLPEVEVEFDYGVDELSEEEEEEEEEEASEDQPCATDSHSEEQQECCKPDRSAHVPCPHHAGEAPLSELVDEISTENDSSEHEAAQQQECVDRTEAEQAMSIELIASEIVEPSPEHENLTSGEESESFTPCKAAAGKVDAVSAEQQEHAPQQVEEILIFGQSVSAQTAERFAAQLFEGDRARFDEQVSLLAAMESIDDALIHISQQYKWRGDNRAAQEFIELLEKHFE